MASMLAVRVQPSIPYPGRGKPWPGVCLRCGQPVKPRLGGIKSGQGACVYCAKVAVDTAVAEGRMLAAGLQPLVPFPGSSKPWLGTCLSCGEHRSPTYNAVRSGQGVCATCGNLRASRARMVDHDTAYAAMLAVSFRPYGTYPGNKVPWKGVCLVCGTEGAPKCNAIVVGQGPCVPCGVRKSAEGRTLSHDEALAVMLSADFQPEGPYPGALKPSPGHCLVCGTPGNVRYAQVQAGRQRCVRGVRGSRLRFQQAVVSVPRRTRRRAEGRNRERRLDAPAAACPSRVLFGRSACSPVHE